MDQEYDAIVLGNGLKVSDYICFRNISVAYNLKICHLPRPGLFIRGLR